MKLSCLACGNIRLQRQYLDISDYEYGVKYHAVNFLRCRDCGLLKQDLLPSFDSISSFYPLNYRSYTQFKRKGFFAALKYFQFWYLAKKLTKLVAHRKAKILEIGCGNGALLLALKRHGFSRLWGSDISNSGAKFLAQNDIKFQKAIIEKKFPFQQRFEMIILHNVIEHLLDPKHVLATCKRYLSEKGKIIIITPNSHALELDLFKKYWDGFHAPRHFFVFSIKAMQSLRKKMNFHQLVYFPQPDPGQWAISLQNVFQNISFLKTRLKSGLAWYTVFCGILFTPISLLAALGKRSSSVLYILE